MQLILAERKLSQTHRTRAAIIISEAFVLKCQQVYGSGPLRFVRMSHDSSWQHRTAPGGVWAIAFNYDPSLRNAHFAEPEYPGVNTRA